VKVVDPSLFNCEFVVVTRMKKTRSKMMLVIHEGLEDSIIGLKDE